MKFLLALLLLTTSAFAQEVTLEQVRILDNVTAPRIVAGRIFVGRDTGTVVARDGLLLSHPTGYKIERVRIKKNGLKVEGVNLPTDTGKLILFTEPGKYSFDVIMLDLEKGSLDFEEEVELGGPGPDIPPDDPIIPVPEGPFNNLALRISKIQFPERQTWATTTDTLAKKMATFEIKTEQAIKAELAKLTCSDPETCAQLNKILGEFTNLGWQNRILFFSEIAKGLR